MDPDVDPDVHVRSLTTRTELEDASALFTRVWRAQYPLAPFPLLRGLSHAGGMVLGAYRDGHLVGAAMGFVGADRAAPSLHSHIVGVERAWQGTGVGTVLKHGQRQWCLDRGITRMTWTFDPLVRRNATFNMARIGAVGVAYYPDYYGPMDDAYNVGVPTDRVLVSWDLAAERSVGAGAGAGAGAWLLDVGEHGEPLRSGLAPADVVHVRVPDEVEPALLLQWRAALRDVLRPLFDSGYRWTDVTGDGWYVLDIPDNPDNLDSPDKPDSPNNPDNLDTEESP